MTFLRQSIVIILATCLTFLLKSMFFNATVPFLVILILFYAVLARRKRTENLKLFVLTSLILILVTSTGEISSPLFFLLYILSFGIGLLFDPKLVFVFITGLIVLLFPSALKGDVSKNLFLLFSFIPLSGLAFFVGKAYQENQKSHLRQGFGGQAKIKSQNRKSKLKIHSKILFLLIVNCYLLLVTAPTAQGQTMSNKDYIIQMEGFNTSSGVSESSDYKINSNVGDLNPITSEGVNYKVKTGFENIAPTLPFSISLSSDIIDFGILSPTNPVIRTVDLGINSPSTYGYSVIIFENQALTTIPPASKTFIPDTTCDNGRCDSQNAADWTNTLTYGFGYRCDNVTRTDCDKEFKNLNFYKRFPNIEKNDSLQSIMSGFGHKNSEARVSYKVNISGNQAEGIYGNIITFIAVPNF